jgi:hypothetical protein
MNYSIYIAIVALLDSTTKLCYHHYYCMIGLCHLMAGDDSRMAGGESRMTGDCCRPEGSIHTCVRTHSHLYSYIYGLVALLDNKQSSFSSITISTGYEPGAHYNLYYEYSIYISQSRATKSLNHPRPSLFVTVATAAHNHTKTQHHHDRHNLLRRQKCKSTIDCATCTRAHVQLIASFLVTVA